MMSEAAALVLVVGVLGYLLASMWFVPFVALEKGRSGFGWMFFSLIFSPLLALIALAGLPVIERDDTPTSSFDEAVRAKR